MGCWLPLYTLQVTEPSCLVKLDEEIFVGNEIFSLGANEFIDGIQPQGYRFLKEFNISPFPTYLYKTENIEVRKTIFIPHERNAVVALYHVKKLRRDGFQAEGLPCDVL